MRRPSELSAAPTGTRSLEQQTPRRQATRSAMLAAGLALAAAGCPRSWPMPDDWQQTDSATADGEDPRPVQVEVAYSFETVVDILFVIDDSLSMASEQANLTHNFASFLNVLTAPEQRTNFRIGFTTTDNGNPWCTGTSAEHGAFVLSSCRSRIDDFVVGGVDHRAACLDVCPETLAELSTRPTTTDFDDTPRSRPWIENIDCTNNLPEGVTLEHALQCFAPQGIAGCGFEQPLESMFRALGRAHDQDDPAYGFLRDTATLVIIIITDEPDCSYNDDAVEIFANNGNRVFWSLPDASAPTSAVCWNAGVACTGGPGRYDECHAADFDLAGRRVPADRALADAALHPLGHYTRYVRAIAEYKQAKLDAKVPRHQHPRQPVYVSLIAGVPTSYPDEAIIYRDAPLETPERDLESEAGLGIAPGCSSEHGEAMPPVREREFAEAFAEPVSAGHPRDAYSICGGDFSSAIHILAEKLVDQIKPICMPDCAADTDPSTPWKLDEHCSLVEEITLADGTHHEHALPQCHDDGSIPNGAAGCHVAIDVRNDPSTASPECIERGYNLEFRFNRPANGCPPTGSTTIVHATCELSRRPDLDCPTPPY